jgi:hypothetical protein
MGDECTVGKKITEEQANETRRILPNHIINYNGVSMEIFMVTQEKLPLIQTGTIDEILKK